MEPALKSELDDPLPNTALDCVAAGALEDAAEDEASTCEAQAKFVGDRSFVF